MRITPRGAGITVVALAGTAAAVAGTLSLASVGAPRLDAESAESYNATVFSDSVEYYKQVCPQITRITGVSDMVSISLENSVGAENAAEIRMTGLRDSAGTLRDAATILGGIPAPIDVFNASGNVNYTGATQPLIDASNHWADELGRVEGLLAENKSDEADKEQPQVMSAGSSEISNSLSKLIADAAISNAKTRDEIAKQPGCDILFNDSPTPAPTQVIEPAADFHARLSKAASLVTDGTKPLRELPSMEGKPLMEAAGILRDGWVARADAAANAVRILSEWKPPANPDPVTQASLEGYDKAHTEAVELYKGIEKQARETVDYLNGVKEDSDPQQLDEFLVKASDAASQQSIAEAKLHIRTSRTAPLPNTATAERVDGIQESLS